MREGQAEEEEEEGVEVGERTREWRGGENNEGVEMVWEI